MPSKGPDSAVRELVPGPLEPGAYCYPEADPQITLQVGPGWQNGHLDPEFYDVVRAANGSWSAVLIIRPLTVYGDPPRAPSTPDDAVALLRENAVLTVGPARDVVIADASGREVDITATAEDTPIYRAERMYLGIGPSTNLRLAFLDTDAGLVGIGLVTERPMDAWASEASPVLESMQIEPCEA